MKLLWRICLTALLVLQTIALPLHALSEDMQHSAGHDSHHHHAHANDAHQSLGDASVELSADTGEHGCVNHCHMPIAALGDAIRFDAVAEHSAAISKQICLTQILPEPIDRPQWHAARV